MLDPSIPLSVQPPKLMNLSDVFAEQQRQQALQTQQRTAALQQTGLAQENQQRGIEIQENQAVKDAITKAYQGGGGLEDALPGIMQASPTRGALIQKTLLENKKTIQELQNSALEHDTKSAGFIAQQLTSVKDPDSYAAALASLHAAHVDTSQMDPVYDPAKVAQWIQKGTSIQEQLNQAKERREAATAKTTEEKNAADAAKAQADAAHQKMINDAMTGALAAQANPQAGVHPVDAILGKTDPTAAAAYKVTYDNARKSDLAAGDMKMTNATGVLEHAAQHAAELSPATTANAAQKAQQEAGAKMPVELEIARRNREAQQGFQSYNSARQEVDKTATPLEQTAQKIANIQEKMNSGIPQDWANVPAMFLSLSAGGQGSGLRMNQALIEQEMGGAGKLAQAQGFAQSFNPNTDKASKIGPIQQEQFKRAVAGMAKQVQARIDVLNQTRSALDASGNDVAQHRQLVTGMHTQLSQLDQQTGNKAAAPQVAPKEGDIVTNGQGQRLQLRRDNTGKLNWLPPSQ